MDGLRDYHAKQSKSERERHIYITYLWTLKYDTNELIYKTDSQTQRTDVRLPRRRVGEEGMGWEVRVSRCMVLHTEWINKALRHSTGNYIQYAVIKHNG